MSKELCVLCVNSGSSSLKLALWALGEGETLRMKGKIEGIGVGHGSLQLQDGHGRVLKSAPSDADDHRAAANALFDAIESAGIEKPQAIGHRIVHGGPDHRAPERLSGSLLSALRRLIGFAPLHLPSEIAAIEIATERFAPIPQVACFDTAFHRRMPELAQRLPLPRKLWDEGIRRYGFHGLSYEYIVQELAEAARGRLVIAHLGNGASLAAVHDGQPLDTTMGFSPTGGLMMGTRSGDLDPGVLLHLARAEAYDTDALERLVNREAGLLGVSGISADMKMLLEARAHDPHAARAIDMFCQGVKKQIGAMAAVLGGLDTLVFTGGIGERAAPVRWAVCEGLSHLGLRLDAAANQAHSTKISTSASPCAVRVIATDEDRMIARHTRALLFAQC